jgi:6-phosphogluconolactonase
MRNGRSTTLSILLVLVAGLAIRLDAQFVYTQGRINGANKILGFSITSTGALVPVPGSPFTAGSEPGEIVADPKGKYLYVVNLPTLTDGGNISAFRVSSAGELSPVPGSPFGRSYYRNLLVDPNGKFVFVTIISVTQDPLQPPSPDLVAAFRIGPSGSLQEVPGSPFLTGVNSGPLVTDRSGQFLYVGIDDEEPSWAPEPPYIAGYKIEQNGALTPLPGSPFASNTAGYAPVALVVDPRGQYIYEFNDLAFNDGTGSSCVYQIADDGSLVLVPDSTAVLIPSTTGIGLAIADPKAGFVYAALSSTLTHSIGTIVSSKIGAQGSLTPIVVPPLTSGYLSDLLPTRLENSCMRPISMAVYGNTELLQTGR